MVLSHFVIRLGLLISYLLRVWWNIGPNYRYCAEWSNSIDFLHSLWLSGILYIHSRVIYRNLILIEWSDADHWSGCLDSSWFGIRSLSLWVKSEFQFPSSQHYFKLKLFFIIIFLVNAFSCQSVTLFLIFDFFIVQTVDLLFQLMDLFLG